MISAEHPIHASAGRPPSAFENFPLDRDEFLTLADQSGGIGIWQLDLIELTMRGTTQFFRMMGLTPAGDTVPLHTMAAVRHPEDSERVRQAYRHAIDSRQDQCEVQFRILRPDGEIRWILGRGRVIRDQAGQAVRYIGINVDITESRRTEAALRESEARFRRVFEQSPLGKATAGPDFTLREVNPALCAMLGHAPEELLGRNFLELVHPGDRDSCAAAAEALLSGATPQLQLETRYIRRSGEPFWVSVTVGPIRDSDGNILYNFAIFEDIDERRRISQSLQDNERRLRELNERLEQLAERGAQQLASSRAQLQAFFDNSLDWLTLIRVTPDGRCIFTDANTTTQSAYGLPRDRIVGRTVEAILGPEQALVPLDHLRECIRTGMPQRYVAHRTMADRTTTIDVMFVPVPLHDDSSDRYIITTARDITEREELEAQLRQAQKMEAIGQLTGGVAHDFNNLLAVIAGNAELARRGRPERTPRMMDNILRACERGVALTRQLLSFSRRRSANPQVLDLRIEVPRITEMLRASLRGDIRLATAVADDVWPVDVDPGELEIALLNVAANARDAMPGGGTFTIGARNQPATMVGTDQEHVLITLRDTGEGIASEVLGKVFDPFFTTKGPGEGTGLGLSQVYGFAQQSGGSVAIDSQPGHGTLITLRLPRAHRPAAMAGAPDMDLTAVPRSERILLVEDNPEVAAVTTQMLQSIGLAVEVIDRPQNALAMLQAGQGFDLLLTDVVMPGGMTGLDLARAARQLRPHLPIVLMSGYNDVADPNRDGFVMLRKPVPFQELSRCICQWLDSAACGGSPGGGR